MEPLISFRNARLAKEITDIAGDDQWIFEKRLW